MGGRRLDPDGSTVEPRVDGRRFSVICLVVFVVREAVVSIVNMAGGPRIVLGFHVFDLTTLLFNWLLPLLIVFRIEGRGPGSLGLRIDRSGGI
jgi:hypothetical protein